MTSCGIVLYLTVFVSCEISLAIENSGHGEKRFLESVQYEWGPWGRYQSCPSVNCELSAKERRRYCYTNKMSVDSSNCHGVSSELIPCTKSECDRNSAGTCVDLNPNCGLGYCRGTYEGWSRTNCRQTCGFCSAGYATPPQMINGGWSDWGDVTPCSVSCGAGKMSRYRVCNNPAPSGGGNPCPGQVSQSFQCYQPPCAPVIDGHWGEWSGFSTCSATCGNGIRKRTRHCDNPAPSGGGDKCAGSDTQTSPCVIGPCPVDGQWGMWAPWTSCSKTCGIGTLLRYRKCNNPAPVANGAKCVGNGTQTHECSLGPCAEWSNWFEGKCSASCGSGTAQRLRHCSTGRDIDCPGNAFEVVPCNAPVCI